MVGEGKENLLANLAGKLHIGGKIIIAAIFDDLIRWRRAPPDKAAARCAWLRIVSIFSPDHPASRVCLLKPMLFPMTITSPVIVIHREHEAIIEHLLNNHLSATRRGCRFARATSLYHQKLRLRILCRRFCRSSSPAIDINKTVALGISLMVLTTSIAAHGQ